MHGDLALAEALRDHMDHLIRNDMAFFRFFAEGALKGRPPVGLFGQVVAGAGRSRPGMIDLKSPMMLIVNFARLYALRHEVRETGTIDRLHLLHELGVTTTSSHKEVLHAFEFLMRLRLGSQVRAISDGLLPDNEIDPKLLTAIEQRTLRQIFAQIKDLQSLISLDFGTTKM